jgi:hypothetical protein
MAKKYVSNKDVSVRIFKSDFMEWFSHVHPAVPHAIYIPVICAMLYVSYSGGAGPLRIGLLFLAGLALWTLFEYVGHRFAFHAGPRIEDVQRSRVSGESTTSLRTACTTTSPTTQSGWSCRHP